MQLDRIKSIYPSLLLAVVLLVVSVGATYLMVKVGVMVGPLIMIGLLGMAGLIWIMKDYRVGVYVMFLLCVFMSYINRMMSSQIQFGIPLDAIAVLTFGVMLFATKQKMDWKAMKSPILYAYIFIVVYQLLQVFNPSAVSLVGWAVALRGNTSFMLFFVFFAWFSSFAEVKKFTMLWLGLALLVALYGIYQEMMGLNAKELAWVYSNPGRVDLLLIWGHMRKFSFLSDPSAYGLFMGFSGLACFVLMLGPFPALHRIVFGISSIIMFVAMSYSGTRTAIAMVAFGIVFYIVMTLRNRATIMVMAAVIVGGGLLLFGPFYGNTVNRIRSTFNTEDDASMGVRDKKRIRLQAYVLSHPFGGGLNTTGSNGVKYSAGHPLAEGWDADSGYLLIALELGWIGLILGLSLFFLVMLRGIINYFALDDPLLKTTVLLYIVPFMALSLAHFTQDAMFQKPAFLVIIATYALMIRIPTYQQKLNNPLSL